MACPPTPGRRPNCWRGCAGRACKHFRWGRKLYGRPSPRLCEERRDEAIHARHPAIKLDCFASLATTRMVELLQFQKRNMRKPPMSTTTHAPKHIDPSASLHAEALGRGKSRGRLEGPRVIGVRAAQPTISHEAPPTGNWPAISP